MPGGRIFAGSPEDHALLNARGARFRARWDRAHGPYCQHQKCWLLDAGHASETAFLGGTNPTDGTVTSPGHARAGEFHDLHVELAGPAATDVHHGFVQRWNEASERAVEGGSWGDADALLLPTQLSASCGTSIVQIQRTVHADRYSDGRATPRGTAYDIAGGERSILAQYKLAIDAAQRTIYIENQAIPVPEIAERSEAALRRGVDIVLLVPADPEGRVRAARLVPVHRALFDRLEALGRYANFILAGLAARNAQDGRSNVYVHGKIMLVDDSWATIGSCNLHAYSLFGYTEMNASFRDPDTVRSLRCKLLEEHLGQDTAEMDDRAALALYRQIARENLTRRRDGDSDWQGMVFALDPAAYAE